MSSSARKNRALLNTFTVLIHFPVRPKWFVHDPELLLFFSPRMFSLKEPQCLSTREFGRSRILHAPSAELFHLAHFQGSSLTKRTTPQPAADVLLELILKPPSPPPPWQRTSRWGLMRQRPALPLIILEKALSRLAFLIYRTLIDFVLGCKSVF